VASDNVKLSTAKNKMEMACRELQDNSKQIDKTNKQIVEEAKKNRDEIMKTFDKNLDSVKLTEEEAKDYDKENEKCLFKHYFF
jgi:CTP-dependent riboflavin kinase